MCWYINYINYNTMELINHPELNKYYVSKTGEIYDMNKKKVKEYKKNGYNNISINKKMYAVHRLVALTYANNPNNCNIVNHIDENKTNNNATNLEWVTQKENCNKHTKIISHVRKVIQRDLQNNVIAIHDSVTQAGVAIGLTRHAVNKVCIGENKTAGGFIWEYENKDHNHLEDVDLASAKSVVDYPNYYVFPTGCIFNKQRKSFMKPCINENGSQYITLSSSNGKKNKYVHNLIATLFIENTNNYKNVRHIDKNKNNNNVSNLEWY
jgi:hypothetical protein